MAVFKCKMCGGTIEFEPGATVGVCDSCGTRQTLPRLEDDRRANLYDRANHFRRNNEFDKAAGMYEQILNDDPSDAEAYWSLVLCRYGIEYVEDPATHKRVPTVNRAQFTSIFDDDNYKAAVQHADEYQRSLYEEEAAAINEIQKGILSISQQEEPFDVFICYKETDNSGRRTQDSVLANDLYHQLTQEGFRVFFSRITLEDKLGTAYEPYIFAALNSAKVMVVLGTKAEYFNAVWVKNEWSRYLALVKQSGGKKILIPAYKDMDPYDLPDEFSHLQAQDMSKLGFMQDLIRGIKKIVNADRPIVSDNSPITASTSSIAVAPLLKRAFMFLEDGDWSRADEFCEQVLNADPESAEAYLGKLMANLQVRHPDDLADCAEPFDDMDNYQKALRFADGNLAEKLKGYIDHIVDRNKQARIEHIYETALAEMNEADGKGSEELYAEIIESFKTTSGYLDSDERAGKAELLLKEAVYNNACDLKKQDTSVSVEEAIEKLNRIRDYKDADQLINECHSRLKVLEEMDRSLALKRKRKRVVVLALAGVALMAFFTFTLLKNNALRKDVERLIVCTNLEQVSAVVGQYDDAGNRPNGNYVISWDSAKLGFEKMPLELHFRSNSSKPTYIILDFPDDRKQVVYDAIRNVYGSPDENNNNPGSIENVWRASGLTIELHDWKEENPSLVCDKEGWSTLFITL